MTNSHRLLIAEVPTCQGRAAVNGETSIDGCPGTGAHITLDWADTVGAFTGKLLPTGQVRDLIAVNDKSYEVSLVDCGNPLIFIRAESLGLKGTESPAEIEANAPLMALIEQIRSRCAVLFGLVDKAEHATEKSPYIPFFSIISPPAAYRTFNGKDLQAEDMDIVSRLLFMLRMHKTHPGTGTVCLGAAARIPGTIVHEALRPEARERFSIRIGNPAGVIPVESAAEEKNGILRITRAAIYRTARRIMDGQAYIRTLPLEQCSF